MHMNERQAAFSVLLKFANRHERLDDLAKRVLKDAEFSPLQLRLFRQLTSGVARHVLFLDDQLRRLYTGRFNRLDTRVIVLLRMGLYELHFIKNIPEYATLNEYVSRSKKVVNTPKAAGLVNAILRGFIRDGVQDAHLSRLDVADALSRRYSFPIWMLKRWLSVWGKTKTEDLCRAFNQPPRFTVRVNRRKTDVPDFLKTMANLNVQVETSEISTLHFRLDSVQPLIASGIFDQGLCSVQDESAAIPVHLLELDEKTNFLDVCAAPGGKFTQALELIAHPRLAVALDNDLKRLQRVKENLTRLGLNGQCVLADARHLPFKNKTFDRVLIDAPCSGQGVIRKHPDIKWRRTADEIDVFSTLQKQILSEAPKVLAENGRLVYSTCSIDPQEDEVVAQDAESLGLKVRKIDKESLQSLVEPNGFIRTFPSVNGMDGSFAALMSRQ